MPRPYAPLTRTAVAAARRLASSRPGATVDATQQRDLHALGDEVRAVRLLAEQVHQLLTPGAAAPQTGGLQGQAPLFNALDVYVGGPSDPQRVLDLFPDQWASRLPAPFDHLRAGSAPLFEDGRISWALEVLGPVTGQRVLELGPLEGGHTFMLDRAGAAHVDAVEGNALAYMRCLVVKELLDVRSARLHLADLVAFLEQRSDDEPYDLTVASGVFYHMQDPLRLLELVAANSRQVLLWTHVYDQATVDARADLRAKFSGTSTRTWRGEEYAYHRQEYQGALTAQGFCGGSAATSNWLSRDDLFRALDQSGFDVVDVGFDHPDHPHGPALAIAARRRG